MPLAPSPECPPSPSAPPHTPPPLPLPSEPPPVPLAPSPSGQPMFPPKPKLAAIPPLPPPVVPIPATSPEPTSTPPPTSLAAMPPSAPRVSPVLLPPSSAEPEPKPPVVPIPTLQTPPLLPPDAVLRPLQPVVQAEFILAGDVASFDADRFRALLSQLLPGIEVEHVQITAIVQGSVYVAFTIRTPDANAAEQVADLLRGMTVVELSAVLQTGVESIPTLRVAVVPFDSPPPPPLQSPSSPVAMAPPSWPPSQPSVGLDISTGLGSSTSTSSAALPIWALALIGVLAGVLVVGGVCWMKWHLRAFKRQPTRQAPLHLTSHPSVNASEHGNQLTQPVQDSSWAIDRVPPSPSPQMVPRHIKQVRLSSPLDVAEARPRAVASARGRPASSTSRKTQACVSAHATLPAHDKATEIGGVRVRTHHRSVSTVIQIGAHGPSLRTDTPTPVWPELVKRTTLSHHSVATPPVLRDCQSLQGSTAATSTSGVQKRTHTPTPCQPVHNPTPSTRPSRKSPSRLAVQLHI